MKRPLEDHPPEWHAKRREVIGGSDANKIMAGEWQELWEVKTGRSQGDDLSEIQLRPPRPPADLLHGGELGWTYSAEQHGPRLRGQAHQ